MDSFQLDQQTMDEMMEEVVLRRLPERHKGRYEEFKLVSMDILCDVREGERLTDLTVFFSANTLRHNRRA
ncbi:hypothetical protein EVJ30_14585 [Exiguobacterium sp. SH5S13]|uniref:hypothetical protein n=1 Tax=unclassified Exiguobacterium TaxID=2644629 RepID=UPI0010392D0F|nr:MULTISPECIES: hypothetical protein [unclassified Exiguobacterium]TCI24044.1 hypothetical protein EVJ32_15650 [Exiguobacterium sp. SH5S4]TCI49573.1 hypothetical protein EVJ30_14585 [Exiguobacterium sp. SH5S13]